MRPGSLRILALLFPSIFLAATVLAAATIFRATQATLAALADDRLMLVSRSIGGEGPRNLTAIRQRAQIVADRRDTADLDI